MPYIKPELRHELDPWIDDLAKVIAQQSNEDTREAAGTWNYVFTKIILKTTVKGGVPARKYWVLALVCGVLLTMILEFYRRVVSPYEEDKLVENGDVYL